MAALGYILIGLIGLGLVWFVVEKRRRQTHPVQGGIDRSISDLGGADDLLPVLVEDATADPVNFSNPRPVDPASLEAMYRAAW